MRVISDLGRRPEAGREGAKFQSVAEQTDVLTLKCYAAEDRRAMINQVRFKSFWVIML